MFLLHQILNPILRLKITGILRFFNCFHKLVNWNYRKSELNSDFKELELLIFLMIKNRNSLKKIQKSKLVLKANISIDLLYKLFF